MSLRSLLLGLITAGALVVAPAPARADDGHTSTAPATYQVTTAYDVATDTVRGSATNVGGDWYLRLDWRADPATDWQAMAGGPQSGTGTATATNCVHSSCLEGHDFRGDWRTCVILDRNGVNEQTLCGGVVNTVHGPFVDPPPTTSPVVPVVSAWGEASGRPRIGKRVRVAAPTVVVGATVGYRWTLAGRRVGNKQALRIRASWRGRRVVATVRVTAPGEAAQVRKYRFGKVR